ncbi:hypothetical protein [Amycolatopsis sp. ATCC 39116]|nr:hypothetical protein [Amycolatopsis sp. ATCC 39116]
MAICDHEPHLLTEGPGLLIIADKGYVSRELDHYLTERGVRLIRQLIESVNDTLKSQPTTRSLTAYDQ